MAMMAVRKDFAFKPIFGIAPARYVPIAGTVAVAVMVAAIILGVVYRQQRVEIYSRPAGAVVRIDGTRVGTTPLTIMARRGEYDVAIDKDGYAGRRVRLAIPAATSDDRAVIRERGTLAIILTADGTSDHYRRARERIHRWGLTGVSTSAYQKPPIFSWAVDELRAAGAPGDVERALRLGSADITDGPMLADWIRANVYYHNPLPWGEAVIASIASTYRRFGRRIAAAEYCIDLVDGEQAYIEYIDRVRESEWYAALHQRASHAAAALPTATAHSAARPTVTAADTVVDTVVYNRPVVINGSVWLPVPAGEVTVIHAPADGEEQAVGASRTVGAPRAFYIASRPTTNGEFRAFIAAHDAWESARADELRRDGLADENYLRILNESAPNSDALRYVSWHAAVAYTMWQSERLPERWGEYEVRLPTEDEWEYARALYDDSGRVDYSEHALWEWSASPLHAARYALDIAQDDALRDSAIPRVVMRHIADDDEDSERAAHRGALPSDICAPAVGIRPILAVRR